MGEKSKLRTTDSVYLIDILNFDDCENILNAGAQPGNIKNRSLYETLHPLQKPCGLNAPSV
jgi:hypothetical protein